MFRWKAAPIDARMLFGAKLSTAGVMMAISSKPKAVALRMIVPRLPASDGLTRTMWGFCGLSGVENLVNSAK